MQLLEWHPLITQLPDEKNLLTANLQYRMSMTDKTETVFNK